MPDYIFMLKGAFSESVDFLTCAFLSLVTASYFDKMLSTRKNKCKLVNCFLRLGFGVFLLVATVNIVYIYYIFKEKMGSSIIANIILFLFMIIVAVNAIIVVNTDSKKNEK